MKNRKRHAVLRVKKSFGDTVFSYVNLALLLCLAAVTIFPFLYVLAVSLTSLETLSREGSFHLLPSEITFDAYSFVLQKRIIPQSFLVSVTITVFGTAVSLVLTSLLAYALSLARLPGRKIWVTFVLVPMVFGGSIIPLFILVKNLGMMDSLWALIIPSAVSPFNLLLMKNYFEAMPAELSESAFIDGGSHWTVFSRIILPLSAAVTATISLFYAVGIWNGFFNALMFINTQSLKPLQLVLREILMDALKDSDSAVLERVVPLPGMSLKMAAVMISLVPLLVIYPFVQKYFTKGVMVGSVKG